MDLALLRKEYKNRSLRKNDLNKDPFLQFDLWLKNALEAKAIEPNAMMLATSTLIGIPSSRMVLLKHADENGFIFFTNYQSRKAKELFLNPHASLTFWWGELERQVHIEGTTSQTSKDQSITYFAKRPRGSQLGAWASNQDTLIESKKILEENFAKYEEEFADQLIPKPPNWGGFCLHPFRFEFWQGRENRLHDRFQYTRVDGQWLIQRLSP